MEALALIVLVGFLAVVVAVPASILIALSRGKAAMQRAGQIEKRLRQAEDELRALRAELNPLAPAAPPSAPSAIEPASAAPLAQPPAPSPAAPADTTNSNNTDTPPAPEAAEAPDAPAMPDLLARLRQQRESKAQPAGHDSSSPAQPQDAMASAPPVSSTADDDVELEPLEDLAPTPAAEPSPPRPRVGFEELLAGKVFVWIGAIALVLTGAFLLKYGFDHNIINDRVRVIGAGIFGFAMLIAGEFMRRRATVIAQALCGASVATLFGTVLAGSTLYGLIGPKTAFAMMIVITASAVVLSLRHGPLVALLGMVGGFTLPPLLGQPLDAQPGMIVYLIALEMGVLAVTRKRGWMGISALTLLFSMAWSLGYTIIGDSQGDRALTGLLVLATTVVFVLNTAWTHHRSESAPSRLQPLWLSIGAIAAAAALLGLLVNQGGYAMSDLGMLALMGAGTLVLARIDRRYRPLTWVVAGLCTVVLMSWAIRVQQFMDTTDLGVLAGVIAGFGLLFTLGGYACGWSGEPAGRRHFTRLAAVAGPVFLALVTFAGSAALGWREAWWYWTAGVAGLYMLGTAGLLRRGRTGDRWSAQWYAAVSAGLAFVAIGQAVNHPWPAVGWALLAGVCAVLGQRLLLTTLLHGAAALVGISATVLLVLPGPFLVEARGIVIFNTFLPMYALPVLGYLVTAWAGHRAGWLQLSRVGQGLAVVLVAVLTMVLVRHGFAGAAMYSSGVSLYEWPTYSAALMGLGVTLLAWQQRAGLSLQAIRRAAIGVGILGCAVAVAGPVFVGNPLHYASIAQSRGAAPVGGASLAAGMFYLYALPAALALVLAWQVERLAFKPLAQALRVFAAVLTGAFLVMQVRNGFSPADLAGAAVGLYERGTYGLVLLAFGWVLHGWARYHGSLFVRQASRMVEAIGLGVAIVITMLFGNPLLDRSVEAGGGLILALGYLYLLPAAAAYWFASISDRAGDKVLEQFLRVGAIALTACFVGMQVRNGFHFTDLHAAQITLFEWATYGLGWGGLGATLALLGKRAPGRPLLGQAGLVVGLMGVGTAMLGTVLIANPLWTDTSVGTPIFFNGLWYLYGPTILALAVLAKLLRKHGQAGRAIAVGSAAIAVGFLLVCLLVRQGFSADGVLAIDGRPGSAEWYAYSLAWVLLAIGLLVGGIFTGLNTLRYGSMAVMLLAVGKVFALDTAHLADLYRVFSFLGLGVTLLVLGYVYQRFVFGKPGLLAGSNKPVDAA